MWLGLRGLALVRSRNARRRLQEGSGFASALVSVLAAGLVTGLAVAADSGSTTGAGRAQGATTAAGAVAVAATGQTPDHGSEAQALPAVSASGLVAGVAEATAFPDVIAGSEGASYEAFVLALNPDGYWRLNHMTGVIVRATVGGDGAHQGLPELLPMPLTTDSAAGGCVGFDEGRSFTLTTPISSANFTLDCALQLDRRKAKHVIATTGGGDVSGQFSLEVVDDGAGGLQARCWSVTPAGAPHILRSPAGSIPIGEAFKLSYRRNPDGSQSMLIDGVEQSLTTQSGTAPVAWDPPPAGTVYIGAWSSGIDPLDGVMAELAVWNTPRSNAELLDLARAQSIVWLPLAYDAGSVDANASKMIELGALMHPEAEVTLSRVPPNPTRGSTSISGTTITYTAGGSAGNDDAFGVRIAKGDLVSQTLVVTIDVAAASGLNWSLPYAGQWYGGVEYCKSLGDSKLDDTGIGTTVFFYASKSGTVSRFRMHRRTGTGYSAGDGGTYTVQITPADPATKLPIPGAASIARVTGWRPGNDNINDSTHMWPTVNFTTTGQITAGQPYCIQYINTHADPAGNHVALNHQVCYIGESRTGPERYPSGGRWTPVEIDGKDWYPWPVGSINGGTISWSRVGLQSIQIGLADGTWFGPGSRSIIGRVPFKQSITSTQHLRDRWKVTGSSRLVSEIHAAIYRKNNQQVSAIFTLESGPSSNTSGNGSVIEEVTIPPSQIKDVGAAYKREEPSATIVHFAKGTFATPRTLQLGQIYNLRLRASGGTLYIQGGMGCEHGNPNWSVHPNEVNYDWDLYAQQRTLPLNSNIDSMGAQISTNSGGAWSYTIADATVACLPIIMKCTPV